MGVNICIFEGNLTDDPSQGTGNGDPVHFSIGVNTRYGNKEFKTFPRMTAWMKTGQFILNNFKKGDPIHVTSEMRDNDWTDKDGVKKYGKEFHVGQASFVASKGGANGNGKAQEEGEEESAPSSKTKAREPEPAMADASIPF